MVILSLEELARKSSKTWEFEKSLQQQWKILKHNRTTISTEPIQTAKNSQLQDTEGKGRESIDEEDHNSFIPGDFSLGNCPF